MSGYKRCKRCGLSAKDVFPPEPIEVDVDVK